MNAATLGLERLEIIPSRAAASARTRGWPDAAAVEDPAPRSNRTPSQTRYPAPNQRSSP